MLVVISTWITYVWDIYMCPLVDNSIMGIDSPCVKHDYLYFRTLYEVKMQPFEIPSKAIQ